MEEVKYLLGHAIELISLRDLSFSAELPETHLTLEDNAAEKSEFIFQHFKMDCFAEDTGLEIDALNGEPGVFSARYAGPGKSAPDNVMLVLEKMRGMKNRLAKFRTVICLILEGRKFYFEGIVNGMIAENARGEGGFGYDPIFIPEGFKQTFAELDFTIKNEISHRKKAFLKMKFFLKE